MVSESDEAAPDFLPIINQEVPTTDYKQWGNDGTSKEKHEYHKVQKLLSPIPGEGTPLDFFPNDNRYNLFLIKYIHS